MRNAEVKKKKVKQFISAVLHNKNAMVGMTVLVLVLLAALLAPVIAPYDYAEMNMDELLMKPCAAHIMGTDNFGRDVFSRILYGTRISVFVGFVVILLSLLVGVPLGMLAGYYGGSIDTIIMRAVDLMLAFPWVLLALTFAAILSPGLHIVIISLTIAYVPTFIRLMRSVVMSVRNQEYVEAAIVTGEPIKSVMWSYIFPNCVASLIVQASTVLACVIIGEASISYLGMGVQSPTPSWGIMISEASTYLWKAPYLSVWPGVAIIVTVLAVNLLGDGLRDILDPKFVNGV